jgi:ABC-2 type transport system ATP-binding protein/manganese/iron transport system ATP-binding protein
MTRPENPVMASGMSASNEAVRKVTKPAMPNTLKPRIQIPAGTQFGYQEGWFLNRSPVPLVDSLDEVTAEAGLHLVVAPNGSGKTTVLRTLAGLREPLRGRPLVTGRVIYVSDELAMDPELSAGTLFRAWFCKDGIHRANELADRFGLNLRRPIGQLSRGNRQKVLIVIAETLAVESGASLLLLDEPLSGVDAGTRETVVTHWTQPVPSLLRLVVMHELDVAGHADSLISIIGGRLRQARGDSSLPWVEAYRRLQKNQAT